MIICQYCNFEITNLVNICPNCSKFLHRGMLKEILRILKRYLERKDYYSIQSLLSKAVVLTKNTKYEKYILSQIAENDKRIKKIKEQYQKWFADGKKYYEQDDYLKALEIFRKLLTLPLEKKEQKKVEIEILRAKARIYNFEMRELFDDDKTMFDF